jgi:serine/threonine protein kinase
VQEAALLRRVNHPSIVQFMGVAVEEGRGLLLMELMAGDLGGTMQLQAPGGRGRLYGWYNRGHRTAVQIASGLAYLHELGIVHLDLKPQ